MSPASPLRTAIGLLLLTVAACTSDYPPPPDTRVETVTDTLHGVAIPDDYRWLEDQDAPETRAWIAVQNAYAEEVVGETAARDHFRARLRELLDREDVGRVRRAGDREYFTLRAEGEEREVLYRRPAAEPLAGSATGRDGAGGNGDPTGGAQERAEPSPDSVASYQVVLDPADFDPGYRVIPDLMSFSPDDALMMYSVRQGGADEIQVRVMDLETLEDLPDVLPDALYGGFDWDDDDRGFTYVHRDRYTGPRLRHHRLGTPVADDPVLWGEGYGPETFLSRTEAGGGRWMLYGVQHGWARNDWFIQDLEAGAATAARAAGDPVPAAGLVPIVQGIPAHFQVRWQAERSDGVPAGDGALWIRTDWQAPNYRLMRTDPRDPSPENWQTVLAEEPDAVLQDWRQIDGRIYATYLVDVAQEVRVFQEDGTWVGTLPRPAMASLSVSDGDEDDEPSGELELSMGRYLRPSITVELEANLDGASATTLADAPVTDTSDLPFDTTGLMVTKRWFTSPDGTRAPVHILHRADVALDGTNPTILNGYGGFNVSLTPGFSTTRAAWVEAGGVWAVATLRGGSEFGETWHRAGMLANKINVFRDFIAAAELLVDEGWASPDHLGISGGSNGGLLVAAAATLRPDLFRAVLCTYPDLDMLRFWAFQDANNMPALLEYGDARNPEHFAAMREYSPYQAVTDGVDYPAFMFTTGDLDTRVPPLQARKMAARLQAASASGLPVILWYDEMGGHAAGRGVPTSLRIEDTARSLAFMAGQLGLEVPTPSNRTDPGGVRSASSTAPASIR